MTLKNAALVPYPDGDPLFTPPSTQSIMQFRVGMMNPNDTMASPPIPENITVHPVVNTTGALVRTHTMIEIADANDFPTGSLLSNLTWMDRVTETPFLGSTEIWEFINLTPDAHPMHIHLIKFKVTMPPHLSRKNQHVSDCSIDPQFPSICHFTWNLVQCNQLCFSPYQFSTI